MSNLPSITSQPLVMEIVLRAGADSECGAGDISSGHSSADSAFCAPLENFAGDKMRSAAAGPKRSRNCSAKRLCGSTVSLEWRQKPWPANSPQEPNAQFCAPGGFSHAILAATQFHKTELAAAQPAPASSPPRFIKSSRLPSMRTLSKSVPLDQL